ncbi:MAG: hypothetical protein P4L83_06685 [Nevskia sp.]|nr:hypothetical protein [Nevskia sp.]
MSEKIEAIEDEVSEDSAEGEAKRQRSTIGFPYSDYEDAEKIAQAIHGNVGHGTCSLDQLGPWTNQSPKSSTFRSQVGAARMFGLIESEGTETYRLSPLGVRAIDQAHARGAKADAFLNVPLFKAVFDKYKGHVLPPPAALEREIVSLGVSEKQKARARQVLVGSAEQTGFHEQGKNKLVMPAVVVTAATPPAPEKNRGGGGGGDDGGLQLDPLLMALLRKIPTRDDGWPPEKRVRWLRTFAMNVSQVYDDDESPVEMKIEIIGTPGS